LPTKPSACAAKEAALMLPTEVAAMMCVGTFES
jgi:hypothetical protein